jgi:nitrite reductase/ring-hydroxylating ferredoxin subunit
MEPKPDANPETYRRTFLSTASSAVMAGGLLASYGTLAYVAGRFLYLNQPRKLAWIFVAEAARIRLNETIQFRTPAGQPVTITRVKEGSDADAFLALSTTCPHLGCRVHWEPHNSRFFCPCHNGVFDAQGKATQGPPADANQSLPQFPVKVENGLVFIEAPTEVLG